MTNILGNVAALISALLIVQILTPYIARLAKRLGAIDHPDGNRKSQLLPVPRGGGVAVALAAFVAVPVGMFFSGPVDPTSTVWLLRALLPAVSILLVVGVIDDFFTLTGIYKLIGQVLAVSVLVTASAL